MTDVAEIPVVILAGGRGARFDHESQVKPKPMIEVAGKPILQHIIDGFLVQGFRRFIVTSGYLGGQMVSYFREKIGPEMTNGPDGAVFTLGPITIVVMPTGEDSHTGERVAKVRPFVGKRFVLTYGDGLSDVDMRDVLRQHEQTGAGVTMTVVHPPGRFGVIEFSDSNRIETYTEKPMGDWINGGFMVCEREFIDQYIEGDNPLEMVALKELANDGGLYGYPHAGYWRCMDTRRDLEQIEDDVKLANGLLPWRKDMVW